MAGQYIFLLPESTGWRYKGGMRAALFLLALVPTLAIAGNFAECLIDNLPGVANDVAANAIMQTCQAKNPGGIQAVAQGSGRGWLGYKSGAECTAKKAADTRSDRAAALIRQACMRLYDEPKPIIDWDQYELVSPPPTIDWDQYEIASPPPAQ